MFWQHLPVNVMRPRWLILFTLLEISTAAQFNRTIDDTLGDSVTGEKPLYLPNTVGVWQDADCKGCLLQPDRILAFNGTWTTATYTPTLGSMSVELSFKGTAIYVFFILADIVEQDNPTETACNFTLDGRPIGKFHHTPLPTNEFLFDSPVFSHDNLSNVDHRLSISTSGLDHKVWLNFDYAIYTTDDTPVRPPPSPPPSSKPTLPTASTPSGTPSVPPLNPKRPGLQTGVIVGGVVGAFMAILTLVLVFFLWYRRRQHAKRDDDEFPITLSRIPQYNDSNAQFITPFANPYMSHTANSESLAILPFTTYPQPGVTDRPAMGTNPYFVTPPYAPHVTNLMNAAPFRREKSSVPVNTVTRAEASTSSSAPLVFGLDLLPHHASEALRRERQAEIGRQIDVLKGNMRNLKAVEPFKRQRNGEANISHMKGEIRALREQIVYLQAHQQFSWTQGLSNEPPPGYSAPPPSHSISQP